MSDCINYLIVSILVIGFLFLVITEFAPIQVPAIETSSPVVDVFLLEQELDICRDAFIEAVHVIKSCDCEQANMLYMPYKEGFNGN